MPKHTQGPWKVDEATGIVYIEIGTWEPGICHTQAKDMECLSPESAIANARLIAAAPELLEVLEFIFEQITNTKNAYYTLDEFSHGVGIYMARKTIAKAKGGT